MCGIIGYTGARSAVPLLLGGLRRLEYRGYDSAGVAVPSTTGGPVQLARCQGKIVALENALEKTPLAGPCGIGHTRWATHGRPSELNAHPHRAGDIAVVHNGIIENHAELRAHLQAAGCQFTSETDTEVIAHLVARELVEGSDFLQAVVRATAQLEGAWAIAVVHQKHPDTIVAARHSAPLLLGLGGPGVGEDSPAAENFVASDVSAILQHTRVVVDLEDGDLARITPTSFELVDAHGKPVQRPRRRVEWSPAAAEKQGFRHYMLKEIHEQPRAIRDTMLGAGVVADDVRFEGLDLLGPDLGACARIVMLACGTSFHAALIGRSLIEGLARIPVEVDIASEFRYRDPIVRTTDLALAITQSGETADTIAALKEAKQRGAQTLAICNVLGASISRVADKVLYTHAGPEISVASTKAFTTQLTMMLLLAIHLGRRTGHLTPERARGLLDGLQDLPAHIDNLLAASAAIRIVARRHQGARDCLFLGRGLCYPVALEGALKLKEISYIHAEGYASGEMKHGPIALVDNTMPVVVLAQRGLGYGKVLSNLEEVRARGGKIIAVATLGDHTIGDLADDLILVPDVAGELQPILASIPLQLLAYHFADLKGTDVDQPRNLAKSVTVE
ncbi:glutamine--fructose-6-phosphate transaminase (isomerizing) [Nannocystis bainbridge]|uniref:Glutamine--fructose-6-phosphate aminotransferase [isomerizing] n=1 Tax=Nannocystis bainbridge TaxID=2995303 RepID=A0ABT5DZ25_9BACT|nr:glutamine--fructose-6-phosphate transaminase (isomerizing) [Nannocystis bainbridge]MDC0718821.1 glutamine--fructose-6-phosphate transaminase (isomerizing) [Nannocystis bainbridge]